MGESDPPGGLRIGVIGAEHPHLFTLVEPLIQRGAVAVAHAVGTGLWPDAYRGWQPTSEERSESAVLDDDTLDLIVTAAVPRERARIAVVALEGGTSVLADKPGATTLEDLTAVEAAMASGARWWVLFSERFEHSSVSTAIDMARRGDLGQVVHVIGLGPHSLGADGRPDWFWDVEATGGILVDLASHQADQFLAITGARASEVTIRAAGVGCVGTDDHPAFQDVGHVLWEVDGVVGHHRVDYLEPAGLGVWGDPRLLIVGTTATVEVRPVIDAGGHDGGEHLLIVDRDRTRRMSQPEAPHWADLLVADLADGGERLMARHHSADVTRLTLRAQDAATRWPPVERHAP